MKKITLKPGVVTALPIDDVHPDPDQPRQAFHPKRLQELADNIKARGIRQPITVVMKDDAVCIKTGERRWRAAKLAGLDLVPCLLEAPAAGDAPIDVLFDQLSENDLREDLNPMERAKALARLQQDKLGPTEISEQLARHGIHMARSTVSNLLRLLNLPENIQELVSNGALKESYARDLLPFADADKVTPKILRAFAKKLEKKDEINKRDFGSALDDAMRKYAERINYGETCGKKCKCFAQVPTGWGGTARYCLDKKALQAKRAAAEDRQKKKEAKAAAKKKAEPPAETDPTKVKPKKLKVSPDGAVATSRLGYGSHRALRRGDFDTTTQCEGCPHNHLASYDGREDSAAPTCFYLPCFDNLQRQAGKVRNRRIKIREMLDEQMLPELVRVASEQPVAGVVLPALLAFGVASNAYSYYGALSVLPSKLKRIRLKDFLERQLSNQDISTLVADMIGSMPIAWRHELALHLTMQPISWWKTTEEFAKLFTKAELKDMLPAFDPPDVPVGEWRQRLIDAGGVPVIVNQEWRGDWASVLDLDAGFPDYDEDEPSCRKCGCTQMAACADGFESCHWVELPGEDGLGLCSACVDEKEEAA